MLYASIFIRSVFVLILHNVCLCYSETKLSIEKCPNKIVNKIEGECHTKANKTIQYHELGNIIENIRKQCGSLCEPDFSYTNQGIAKEIAYKNLRKIPNCNAIWNTYILVL